MSAKILAMTSRAVWRRGRLCRGRRDSAGLEVAVAIGGGEKPIAAAGKVMRSGLRLVHAPFFVRAPTDNNTTRLARWCCAKFEALGFVETGSVKNFRPRRP